jgi:hypothetical protein
MEGGIRMTHSTDFFSVNIFRIYCALPFLHELRVLTDWTVTKTSLNFFMWMKLEDAHHNLFRVRLDMEYRRMTREAEKRPICEKFLVGGLLLLALLILLVGPVLFFSSLNLFFVAPNPVTGGKLSIGIEVEPKGKEGGFRQMEIYSASQEKISDHKRTEVKLEIQDLLVRKTEELKYQEIFFPFSAENFWPVNKETRKHVSELLRDKGKAFITYKLTFDRKVGAPSGIKGRVTLNNDGIVRVATVLEQEQGKARNRNEETFDVPGIFPAVLRLNDSPDAEDLSATALMNFSGRLTLKNDDSMQTWSVARTTKKADYSKTSDHKETSADRNCDVQNKLPEDCRLSFWLLSEYVSTQAGDKKTSERNGGSSSVVAIYLTVVLTIGNVIRRLFVDTSKRIIYEEMPETELLLDLCNGIYIARIQGNLKAEWDLYHELLRIYRSPEMLLDVTKEKRSRENRRTGRGGRCEACNHMNSAGSKFCRMCGEELKDQSEAEVALIPRNSFANSTGLRPKPKPKEGPKRLNFQDAVQKVLLQRERPRPVQLENTRSSASEDCQSAGAGSSAPSTPLLKKGGRSRGDTESR